MMLQRDDSRPGSTLRLGYGGLNHRRVARSERVSITGAMQLTLKHLKSGREHGVGQGFSRAETVVN